MRVCTRCNTNMLVSGLLKAEPVVSGDGFGKGHCLVVYRTQDEKGILKHFLDYDSPKVGFPLQTAFCPECGMVETFVDKEKISMVLNVLSD